MRILFWLLLALAISAPARGQEGHPHAESLPAWFSETFLDLREDAAEAARAKKRLLVYFGQDGCPYCRELLQTNFSQKRIEDKTRRHFTAIAINIWGDREVTAANGKAMTEKEFAKSLGVQFTPTVLFLDERGETVARLNGYYPPHRFEAVLDYVAGRMEKKRTLAEHLRLAAPEAASPDLHEQPFFLGPPYDLRRKAGAKPLAVLFETRHCAGCDELHKEGFRRPEMRDLLARFDVVRLPLFGQDRVVAPDGRSTTAGAWASQLGLAYSPSIVFFGSDGREAFRVEAYLRPFHLASSFEYVSSGAYRREPEFQRFLQGKAERLRERGEKVELWR